MAFNSIKRGYETAMKYNDILSCAYGIDSLQTNGLDSARFVQLSSEGPATNGEDNTDNGSVTYPGVANGVGPVLGIVKDGCTDAYAGLTLIPGSNRDYNVTVVVLGQYYVEVAPGQIIAKGSILNSNIVGQAVATGGTATTFIAMTAATGVGTAANPEFVRVLIR